MALLMYVHVCLTDHEPHNAEVSAFHNTAEVQNVLYCR